jgi:hypothetical protein
VPDDGDGHRRENAGIQWKSTPSSARIALKITRLSLATLKARLTKTSQRAFVLPMFGNLSVSMSNGTCRSPKISSNWTQSACDFNTPTSLSGVKVELISSFTNQEEFYDTAFDNIELYFSSE